MKFAYVSAVIGLVFGLPGLFVGGAMILGPDLPNLFRNGVMTLEGLSVIIPFIIASALFGIWTGNKIEKRPNLSWLYGILSSFFTTWTTCIVYFIFLLFDQTPDLSAFFGSLFMLLFYSTLLGGIPMIIIGAVFGWVLQYSFKERNHDLQ